MPAEPLRVLNLPSQQTTPAEALRNVRDTLPQPAEGFAPLLLDSRQAAKLLHVSERTLWALTDEQKLPCVRLGRAKRYRLTDVQKFVDSLK
jgi:excisionase family DNA binding protein